MKEPSPRRRVILDFIRSFVEEHSYPPTVRDIQYGLNISSTSVVDHHLRALEREGQLRRDCRVSRGMELIGENSRRNTSIVPLVGMIAAGEPITVPQPDAWNTDSGADTLELPSELVKGKPNVYGLKVKGTSMIDALINDGDIVLMQPAQQAENGEMVAVWLKRDKTVTLKKLYREKDVIRLQPANSAMKAIRVPAEDVEVQGRVVGVIRTY